MMPAVFLQVAGVRKTAPKDAMNRVLENKKCNRERLCKELKEAKKAKRRCVRIISARRRKGGFVAFLLTRKNAAPSETFSMKP